MATLVRNIKTFFPLAPEPPNQKVAEISVALDTAMLTHITTVYIPAGFGATFMGALITSTPFLLSLGTYLDTILSPILTTALSLENNPTTPQPHLLAWGSIQGSFDALIPAVPPFMAGIEGALLWQAILFTIRFFIVPEFPPPPESETFGEDGLVTLESEI